MSSLTNLGLGLAVARAVTPREFGLFSIVFSSYLIALGISRAFSTDPLVVRFSSTKHDVWRPAVAQATGTALGLGMVFATVALVVTSYSTVAGAPFLILGLSMPGLMVQDSYRAAFFAGSKAEKAFWNDLLRLLLLILGVLVLAQRSSLGLSSMLIAWGVAGTIASFAAAFQMGIWPKVRHSTMWIRNHRDLGPRYAGEFALGAGGSQLSIFGVGAVAGLPAAGAIRGAQILLGAITVVFQGISSTQTPEAVKLARKDIGALRDRTRRLSFGLAGAAMLWTSLMLLIPDSAGIQLMGSNWSGSSALLLPIGTAMVGAGVIAGTVIGLRGMGAATNSIRAQALAAPCTLALTVGGARVSGAIGAATGMATASILAGMIWWRQLRLAYKAHERDTPSMRPADTQNTSSTTKVPLGKRRIRRKPYQ